MKNKSKIVIVSEMEFNIKEDIEKKLQEVLKAEVDVLSKEVKRNITIKLDVAID